MFLDGELRPYRCFPNDSSLDWGPVSVAKPDRRTKLFFYIHYALIGYDNLFATFTITRQDLDIKKYLLLISLTIRV